MNKTRWDDRYDIEAYVFGVEPNDFLREREVLLPRGARVLSLAEGEGRNAVFLAERGHEVSAVDSSAVGRQKALKLAARRGVSVDYAVADVLDHPLMEQAWDAVVMIFLHMPVVSRRVLMEKICRSLRPGGLCLFEAYHLGQTQYKTGGPSDPALLWEPAEIRGELAGLREIQIEEKIRHIEEGEGHYGPSAVVQVTGWR